MFETWEELEKSISNCNKCKLCKTRQNIVFGVGKKDAKIMFYRCGFGIFFCIISNKFCIAGSERE